MEGVNQSYVNQAQHIGHDTQVILQFQNQKKSMAASYILWYLFGFFGAHRFYLGETKTAIIQLILTLTIIGIIITFVWWIVDAFLIPKILRTRNAELLRYLTTFA